MADVLRPQGTVLPKPRNGPPVDASKGARTTASHHVYPLTHNHAPTSLSPASRRPSTGSPPSPSLQPTQQRGYLQRPSYPAQFQSSALDVDFPPDQVPLSALVSDPGSRPKASPKASPKTSPKNSVKASPSNPRKSSPKASATSFPQPPFEPLDSERDSLGPERDLLGPDSEDDEEGGVLGLLRVCLPNGGGPSSDLQRDVVKKDRARKGPKGERAGHEGQKNGQKKKRKRAPRALVAGATEGSNKRQKRAEASPLGLSSAAGAAAAAAAAGRAPEDDMKVEGVEGVSQSIESEWEAVMALAELRSFSGVPNAAGTAAPAATASAVTPLAHPQGLLQVTAPTASDEREEEAAEGTSGTSGGGHLPSIKKKLQRQRRRRAAGVPSVSAVGTVQGRREAATLSTSDSSASSGSGAGSGLGEGGEESVALSQLTSQPHPQLLAVSQSPSQSRPQAPAQAKAMSSSQSQSQVQEEQVVAPRAVGSGPPTMEALTKRLPVAQEPAVTLVGATLSNRKLLRMPPLLHIPTATSPSSASASPSPAFPSARPNPLQTTGSTVTELLSTRTPLGQPPVHHTRAPLAPNGASFSSPAVTPAPCKASPEGANMAVRPLVASAGRGPSTLREGQHRDQYALQHAAGAPVPVLSTSNNTDGTITRTGRDPSSAHSDVLPDIRGARQGKSGSPSIVASPEGSSPEVSPAKEWRLTAHPRSAEGKAGVTKPQPEVGAHGKRSIEAQYQRQKQYKGRSPHSDRHQLPSPEYSDITADEGGLSSHTSSPSSSAPTSPFASGRGLLRAHPFTPSHLVPAPAALAPLPGTAPASASPASSVPASAGPGHQVGTVPRGGLLHIPVGLHRQVPHPTGTPAVNTGAVAGVQQPIRPVEQQQKQQHVYQQQRQPQQQLQHHPQHHPEQQVQQQVQQQQQQPQQPLLHRTESVPQQQRQQQQQKRQQPLVHQQPPQAALPVQLAAPQAALPAQVAPPQKKAVPVQLSSPQAALPVQLARLPEVQILSSHMQALLEKVQTTFTGANPAASSGAPQDPRAVPGQALGQGQGQGQATVQGQRQGQGGVGGASQVPLAQSREYLELSGFLNGLVGKLQAQLKNQQQQPQGQPQGHHGYTGMPQQQAQSQLQPQPPVPPQQPLQQQQQQHKAPQTHTQAPAQQQQQQQAQAQYRPQQQPYQRLQLPQGMYPHPNHNPQQQHPQVHPQQHQQPQMYAPQQPQPPQPLPLRQVYEAQQPHQQQQQQRFQQQQVYAPQPQQFQQQHQPQAVELQRQQSEQRQRLWQAIQGELNNRKGASGSSALPSFAPPPHSAAAQALTHGPVPEAPKAPMPQWPAVNQRAPADSAKQGGVSAGKAVRGGLSLDLNLTL